MPPLRLRGRGAALARRLWRPRAARRLSSAKAVTCDGGSSDPPPGYAPASVPAFDPNLCALTQTCPAPPPPPVPSAEPGSLYLSTEWCMIPHPDKIDTGGEDAVFATPTAVGIADGVGGWAQHGVDAGELSRALMSASGALACKAPGELEPAVLLSQAWNQIAARRLVGSTTVVLAAVCGAELHTANLGDSGFAGAPCPWPFPPPASAPAEAPASASVPGWCAAAPVRAALPLLQHPTPARHR